MARDKKYIIYFWTTLIIVAVTVIFFYVKKNYTELQSNNNNINITFFSSSKDNINKKYFQTVRELMNSLNEYKNKINVVYGGGTDGLMGEVAKYKGNLISSNLSKFSESQIADEYVYKTIQDRQQKLTDLGDMYITLPGGYGTIYELMEVITLNDIGQSHKPIIIYNVYNFFDRFIQYIETLYSMGFTTKTLTELSVHVFDDKEQVIAFIKKMKKWKSNQ